MIKYISGYLFGLSVLLCGALYLPLFTGRSYGVWIISFIHLVSGILILSKKKLGWLLFALGVGTILFMKIYMANSIHLSIERMLIIYGFWWSCGIAFWILNRKQLS